MQIQAKPVGARALRYELDQLTYYTFNGHVKLVDAYPRDDPYWVGVMLRPAHSASDKCSECDDNRRYGHRSRRLHAVTWSCHAEFLRVLFDQYPRARVRTSSPRGHATIVANNAPMGSRSNTYSLDGWLNYSSSIYRG